MLIYDATKFMKTWKIIFWVSSIPAMGYLSYGITRRVDEAFYLGVAFMSCSLISLFSIMTSPWKIFLLKNLKQIHLEMQSFLRSSHVETVNIENISKISPIRFGRDGYKIFIDFMLYRTVFNRYLIHKDILRSMEGVSTL